MEKILVIMYDLSMSKSLEFFWSVERIVAITEAKIHRFDRAVCTERTAWFSVIYLFRSD